MKTRTFIFFSILFTFSIQLVSGQQNVEKSAFEIGDRVTLKSTILNEDRILNIYLPDGYSKDSMNNYPVIYLLDGSKHEDFIHIAGLVQFGSYSWINMVPKSIVVGIENVDRKKDFTFPTEIAYDSTRWPEKGGSANFIAFIEKEAMPFIKANYSNNENTTLIGQSLGGLLAAEVLIKHTPLFRNYIIVSPSMWWDNKSMSKTDVPEIAANQQVYIAVGKEGYIMRSTACKLYRKTRKSAPRPKEVHFEFFRKQNHADVLHQAVYDAFETLDN